VSEAALGTVLQQEEDSQLHVIGYASRALSAEGCYCITHKGLLGVVYGLKKYRQQLLGRPIIVCIVGFSGDAIKFVRYQTVSSGLTH